MNSGSASAATTLPAISSGRTKVPTTPPTGDTPPPARKAVPQGLHKTSIAEAKAEREAKDAAILERIRHDTEDAERRRLQHNQQQRAELHAQFEATRQTKKQEDEVRKGKHADSVKKYTSAKEASEAVDAKVAAMKAQRVEAIRQGHVAATLDDLDALEANLRRIGVDDGDEDNGGGGGGGAGAAAVGGATAGAGGLNGRGIVGRLPPSHHANPQAPGLGGISSSFAATTTSNHTTAASSHPDNAVYIQKIRERHHSNVMAQGDRLKRQAKLESELQTAADTMKEKQHVAQAMTLGREMMSYATVSAVAAMFQRSKEAVWKPLLQYEDAIMKDVRDSFAQQEEVKVIKEATEKRQKVMQQHVVEVKEQTMKEEAETQTRRADMGRFCQAWVEGAMHLAVAVHDINVPRKEQSVVRNLSDAVGVTEWRDLCEKHCGAARVVEIEQQIVQRNSTALSSPTRRKKGLSRTVTAGGAGFNASLDATSMALSGTSNGIGATLRTSVSAAVTPGNNNNGPSPTSGLASQQQQQAAAQVPAYSLGDVELDAAVNDYIDTYMEDLAWMDTGRSLAQLYEPLRHQSELEVERQLSARRAVLVGGHPPAAAAAPGKSSEEALMSVIGLGDDTTTSSTDEATVTGYVVLGDINSGAWALRYGSATSSSNTSTGIVVPLPLQEQLAKGPTFIPPQSDSPIPTSNSVTSAPPPTHAAGGSTTATTTTGGASSTTMPVVFHGSPLSQPPVYPTTYQLPAPPVPFHVVVKEPSVQPSSSSGGHGSASSSSQWRGNNNSKASGDAHGHGTAGAHATAGGSGGEAEETSVTYEIWTPELLQAHTQYQRTSVQLLKQATTEACGVIAKAQTAVQAAIAGASQAAAPAAGQPAPAAGKPGDKKGGKAGTAEKAAAPASGGATSSNGAGATGGAEAGHHAAEVDTLPMQIARLVYTTYQKNRGMTDIDHIQSLLAAALPSAGNGTTTTGFASASISASPLMPTDASSSAHLKPAMPAVPTPKKYTVLSPHQTVLCLVGFPWVSTPTLMPAVLAALDGLLNPSVPADPSATGGVRIDATKLLGVTQLFAECAGGIVALRHHRQVRQQIASGQALEWLTSSSMTTATPPVANVPAEHLDVSTSPVPPGSPGSPSGTAVPMPVVFPSPTATDPKALAAAFDNTITSMSLHPSLSTRAITALNKGSIPQLYDVLHAIVESNMTVGNWIVTAASTVAATGDTSSGTGTLDDSIDHHHHHQPQYGSMHQSTAGPTTSATKEVGSTYSSNKVKSFSGRGNIVSSSTHNAKGTSSPQQQSSFSESSSSYRHLSEEARAVCVNALSSWVNVETWLPVSVEGSLLSKCDLLGRDEIASSHHASPPNRSSGHIITPSVLTAGRAVQKLAEAVLGSVASAHQATKFGRTSSTASSTFGGSSGAAPGGSLPFPIAGKYDTRLLSGLSGNAVVVLHELLKVLGGHAPAPVYLHPSTGGHRDGSSGGGHFNLPMGKPLTLEAMTEAHRVLRECHLDTVAASSAAMESVLQLLHQPWFVEDLVTVEVPTSIVKSSAAATTTMALVGGRPDTSDAALNASLHAMVASPTRAAAGGSRGSNHRTATTPQTERPSATQAALNGPLSQSPASAGSFTTMQVTTSGATPPAGLIALSDLTRHQRWVACDERRMTLNQGIYNTLLGNGITRQPLSSLAMKLSAYAAIMFHVACLLVDISKLDVVKQQQSSSHSSSSGSWVEKMVATFGQSAQDGSVQNPPDAEACEAWLVRLIHGSCDGKVDGVLEMETSAEASATAGGAASGENVVSSSTGMEEDDGDQRPPVTVFYRVVDSQAAAAMIGGSAKGKTGGNGGSSPTKGAAGVKGAAVTASSMTSVEVFPYGISVLKEIAAQLLESFQRVASGKDGDLSAAGSPSDATPSPAHLTAPLHGGSTSFSPRAQFLRALEHSWESFTECLIEDFRIHEDYQQRQFVSIFESAKKWSDYMFSVYSKVSLSPQVVEPTTTTASPQTTAQPSLTAVGFGGGNNNNNNNKPTISAGMQAAKDALVEQMKRPLSAEDFLLIAASEECSVHATKGGGFHFGLAHSSLVAPAAGGAAPPTINPVGAVEGGDTGATNGATTTASRKPSGTLATTGTTTKSLATALGLHAGDVAVLLDMFPMLGKTVSEVPSAASGGDRTHSAKPITAASTTPSRPSSSGMHSAHRTGPLQASLHHAGAWLISPSQAKHLAFCARAYRHPSAATSSSSSSRRTGAELVHLFLAAQLPSFSAWALSQKHPATKLWFRSTAFFPSAMFVPPPSLTPNSATTTTNKMVAAAVDRSYERSLLQKVEELRTAMVKKQQQLIAAQQQAAAAAAMTAVTTAGTTGGGVVAGGAAQKVLSPSRPNSQAEGKRQTNSRNQGRRSSKQGAELTGAAPASLVGASGIPQLVDDHGGDGGLGLMAASQIGSPVGSPMAGAGSNALIISSGEERRTAMIRDLENVAAFRGHQRLLKTFQVTPPPTEGDGYPSGRAPTQPMYFEDSSLGKDTTAVLPKPAGASSTTTTAVAAAAAPVQYDLVQLFSSIVLGRVRLSAPTLDPSSSAAVMAAGGEPAASKANGGPGSSLIATQKSNFLCPAGTAEIPVSATDLRLAAQYLGLSVGKSFALLSTEPLDAAALGHRDHAHQDANGVVPSSLPTFAAPVYATTPAHPSFASQVTINRTSRAYFHPLKHAETLKGLPLWNSWWKSLTEAAKSIAWKSLWVLLSEATAPPAGSTAAASLHQASSKTANATMILPAADDHSGVGYISSATLCDVLCAADTPLKALELRCWFASGLATAVDSMTSKTPSNGVSEASTPRRDDLNATGVPPPPSVPPLPVPAAAGGSAAVISSNPLVPLPSLSVLRPIPIDILLHSLPTLERRDIYAMILLTSSSGVVGGMGNSTNQQNNNGGLGMTGGSSGGGNNNNTATNSNNGATTVVTSIAPALSRLDLQTVSLAQCTSLWGMEAWGQARRAKATSSSLSAPGTTTGAAAASTAGVDAAATKEETAASTTAATSGTKAGKKSTTASSAALTDAAPTVEPVGPAAPPIVPPPPSVPRLPLTDALVRGRFLEWA